MEKVGKLNALYYADANNFEQISNELNDKSFTESVNLSECTKRQNLLVAADEIDQNSNKVEEAMNNIKYSIPGTNSFSQNSLVGQSPSSIYNLAVLHFQNHNYKEAVSILTTALEIFGKNMKFGLEIKCQFLLMESVFRQYQIGMNFDVIVLRERFLSLYNNVQGAIRSMETQEPSPDASLQQARPMLLNILKYRVNIYYAKLQVMLGLLNPANQTLDEAIAIYNNDLNSIPEKMLSPLLLEAHEYHPILCYLGILPLLRRGLTVQLTRLYQLALNMKVCSPHPTLLIAPCIVFTLSDCFFFFFFFSGEH